MLWSYIKGLKTFVSTWTKFVTISQKWNVFCSTQKMYWNNTLSSQLERQSYVTIWRIQKVPTQVKKTVSVKLFIITMYYTYDLCFFFPIQNMWHIITYTAKLGPAGFFKVINIMRKECNIKNNFNRMLYCESIFKFILSYRPVVCMICFFILFWTITSGLAARFKYTA